MKKAPRTVWVELDGLDDGWAWAYSSKRFAASNQGGRALRVRKYVLAPVRRRRKGK